MAHKLLLADDSVTIQRVIELTFADEDVQVHAVGDGQKAISAIEADRPDIVLADVGMPERDGYEVAAFIKGNPQLAHIPVLLLTGAFEPVDEARARAVGCDGVLVKPFEPQMVINRVKDLLSGRRPTSGMGQPPSAPPPPASNAESAASPAQAPPVPSGSLEDYFDRLDAAFASLESGGPPPSAPAAAAPPASVDDLSAWDPDLSGEAKSAPAVAPPAVVLPAAPPPLPSVTAPQAPVPFVPPQASPAPQDRPGPATHLPAGGARPTLAQAFAALLSAEQSMPVAPSAISPPGIRNDDEIVDEVVRRVIERLGDNVLDAAERLVREEIDRIKRG